MKDDLRAINKEEDRLQRELLCLHKNTLHKHHQVVQKYGIDTKIENTEQLLRKMVNAPAKSINDKGDMKNGPMRPGVDND